MTTERHVWQTLQAPSPQWRRPSVCGCGQDLDLCTREHCPRCGTALVPHVAHAA